MAQEGVSPPPGESSTSRHPTSSTSLSASWALPPQVDATKGFSFSRATPSGLSTATVKSGGATSAGGGQSSRAEGKGGGPREAVGVSANDFIEGRRVLGGEGQSGPAGGDSEEVSSRKPSTVEDENEDDQLDSMNKDQEDDEELPQAANSKDAGESASKTPSVVVPPPTSSGSNTFVSQFRLQSGGVPRSLLGPGLPHSILAQGPFATNDVFSSQPRASTPRATTSSSFSSFRSHNPKQDAFLSSNQPSSSASTGPRPPATSFTPATSSTPTTSSTPASSSLASHHSPAGAPTPTPRSSIQSKSQAPSQRQRSNAPLPRSPPRIQQRQRQENANPAGLTLARTASTAKPTPNLKKRAAPLSTSGREGEVVRTGSAGSGATVVVSRGRGSSRPQESSPGAKRRKSGAFPSSAGGEWLGDVFSSLSGFQSELDRRGDEILSLNAQLAEKGNEVVRLMTEKEKMKRDSVEKIRLALTNFETAKKGLEDTSVGMRSAVTKIQTDMGSSASAIQLRHEVEALKGSLAQRYFNIDGDLWLERNEESKIVILRTLQTEINQRQDVINLLRDQLTTKMGEIVEARDRISQLEQRQDAQTALRDELERVREQARSREDGLSRGKIEAEKRADEAVAREEELRGRFEEGRRAAEEREDELKRMIVDGRDMAMKREEETREIARKKEEELVAKLSEVQAEVEELRAMLAKEVRHSSDLIASKNQLEQTVEDLKSELDRLDFSKKALSASFDEFRATARVEQERFASDLRTLKINHGEETAQATRLLGQTTRQLDEATRKLAAASEELDELRPLTAQLAKVMLDVELAEKKLSHLATESSTSIKLVEKQLSDVKVASAAALDREKEIVRNLEVDAEKLASQLRSKESKISKDEKRISVLEEHLSAAQARDEKRIRSLEGQLAAAQERDEKRIGSLEERLAATREREKNLASAETELRQQLRTAQLHLSDIQTQHDHTDREVAGASRLESEISSLQLQLADLRAAVDAVRASEHALSIEKASLLELNASLKNSVATLNSEHNILINEKESVLVDARRLQHELDAAHTELSSQGKVVAKLQGEIEALRKSEEGARAMAKQLEAAQATLVQQTAASTFKNCEEGFKRELAQKSNELKRANNKLDESTKKLQKVLTELAKAKNRPVIDPHIASSSPVGQVPEQHEAGPSRPTTLLDSDSSLTTFNAVTTLSAIDAMDIVSSEDAEDEIENCTLDDAASVPKSKGRGKATTTTTEVSVAAPEQPGPNRAGRAGRASRPSRSRTIDYDEDEIEDAGSPAVPVALPAPRLKSRPVAKTTYSKKRKDQK